VRQHEDYLKALLNLETRGRKGQRGGNAASIDAEFRGSPIYSALEELNKNFDFVVIGEIDAKIRCSGCQSLAGYFRESRTQTHDVREDC